MGAEQLVMRLIGSTGRIDQQRLRTGRLTEDDFIRLTDAMGKMQDAPMFIDETPALNPFELRARARRLARQYGHLGLIVIDYLQLMTTGKQVESRQQEVSVLSRNLKLLAKDLDIPVVAVAQLNRGPEARTDKKPMMSDLRESGSLEQDADIIMLLHRPEYYNSEDRPGEADIILAKHRNGETGTIRVLFQGHMARFANFTSREEPV